MAIAQQSQVPNRTPSSAKKDRFAHTANTKYGMGDNYGQGIRNKVGKMRPGSHTIDHSNMSNSKMGKPPTRLA